LIDPGEFFEALRDRGVRFYCGVPDSLLQGLCAYIEDHAGPGEHVIVANEGNAVAAASGYHLATGETPLVYMQNSGLGNAVNPLVSLADRDVYRSPLLLTIGWRGEPGSADEPQHLKQGRITPGQLDLLGIPHWVLDAESDFHRTIAQALNAAADSGAPAALLVRKGAFARYKAKGRPPVAALPSREEVLRLVLEQASPGDVFVATTGKTSRELFELRVQRGESQRDFLTVGSMGHSSSIALGIALGAPNRRVVCLDGDGAMLMHLGAVAVAGDLKPANLVHVLINNGAHESVGGQPTAARGMDFAAVASGCGYRHYRRAESLDVLKQSLRELGRVRGPSLLEVKVRIGSREDLGRPTQTPHENKLAFMSHLQGRNHDGHPG
jgi:phosphonopyruvate decarboxylase